MENAKTKLIFPTCFIFIFIFASLIKTINKWVKKIFLGFSWKLPYNLILIWKIQKSDSFFHIFSSSSSFLLRLVKNVLKNGWKFFSHRFSWKFPYNLILIWRTQKLNYFPKFFHLSFLFLPQLVKNGLKNDSKIFSSDFHENFHIT